MMHIIAAGSPAVTATVYTASSAGNADDAANLADIIASGARSIAFAPGQTYIWKSVLDLPSDITIIGGRGAGIHVQLTPTGGPGGYLQAPFRALNANPTGSQFDSTLHANAVNGSMSVSLEARPAVGTWLAFQNVSVTNLLVVAQVVAVSGSGPYLCKLDRKMIHAPVLTAGAQALELVFPLRIAMIGNGMEISGSMDRAIEIGGGQWCTVQGWRITNRWGTPTAAGIALDLAGSFSMVVDNYIDGANTSGGTMANAITAESSRDCEVRGNVIVNVGTTDQHCGITAPDSVDLLLADNQIEGCAVGVSVGSQSNNVALAGSRRVQIRGGNIDSCSVYGIFCGAPEVDITDISLSYNALGVLVSYGASVGGNAGGPVRAHGLRSQSNVGGALQVLSGDVHVTDPSSIDDGVGGAGTPYAFGSTDGGSHACNIEILGGSIALTRDVFCYAVFGGSPGRISLDGGVRLEGPATQVAAHGAAVFQGPTVAELGRVTLAGAWNFGAYMYGSPAATLRRGATLTVASGVGTPVTVVAGSTDSSWGNYATL